MKIQSPIKHFVISLFWLGGSWLSNQAYANGYPTCDLDSNPLVISTNCRDLVISGTTKSAITIEPGVSIYGNWGILNQTTSSSIGILTNSVGSQIDATIYSGIDNEGTISTLNNNGLIRGIGNGISNFYVIGNLNNLAGGVISGQDQGITNFGGGTISTLTNDGTISGNLNGIFNQGTITALNNNTGMISAGINGDGIDNTATITTLTNSGTITSNGARAILNLGTITELINLETGTISSGGTGGIGILNGGGTIISLMNSGTISSDSVFGIYNSGGTITALINSGTISAGLVGIVNIGGTITALTNSGTITAVGGAGIYNGATITTLNNAQGGNGSSLSTTALTYSGNLPTNYNIIINSATHYGQLAVTDPFGAIADFGILGAPLITTRTYASVLSGTDAPTGIRSGTYDNMRWSLTANGAAFDLVFAGASLVGTQQSLVNTATALQNTYALQNAVLTNSFSYDCPVFGENNVCVSAGGRNTAVSAANGLNNTSALLIAAYRIKPTLRIGAYADQNLSVNNAGSTVNLGNSTPLIGLFGVWNQRIDGTGTEVKVAAAYGQKNTTVNRQIVGLSEAGTGSSNLNSQGAQITAKYGFAVVPEVLVSPYVGVRYTQNNMGSYTEGASSAVTEPLTYSALNTNATTALAGVGASYRFIPKATAFASAGVETDTNTSSGTYSATGITGLTPVNFNPNPVKTRPTATLGAYYDIVKNQRIGITGIYRQESYQAISTTTVMATYTIGL